MTTRANHGGGTYTGSRHIHPDSFPDLGRQAKNWQSEGCLLLLDSRALDRECLAKALIGRGLEMEVRAVGGVDDWHDGAHAHSWVQAILFSIGSRKADDPVLVAEMQRLSKEFDSAPIVVLSDTDDLCQVVAMLERGARGFIPSSVGIAVCVEAISLAIAGGIFVPASSVLGLRHLIQPRPLENERHPSGIFTVRQEEVVQALRKGKANKIIAYELNLRESTVKVHVRNIMKKLKASNRTEVVYKLNDLFSTNLTQM
ncbi:MAG: response regulator transcription factor [Pseudomonas sp.]|nr:MAG: response regulator transcription factor [Pseudomonas sp.]